MRLIDADALMMDLEKWMKQVDPTHPQEDNAIPPLEDIIVSTLMTIEEQPTVEAVERKRGEWVELTNTNHTYVCSVCRRMLVNITDGKNNVAKNYPYCHCGAEMRGEEE